MGIDYIVEEMERKEEGECARKGESGGRFLRECLVL